MMASWSVQRQVSDSDSTLGLPCDHKRQGFRFFPPKPDQTADIICSACDQVIGYATRRNGVLQIDLCTDRHKVTSREQVVAGAVLS